jgi:hypothetical protein
MFTCFRIYVSQKGAPREGRNEEIYDRNKVKVVATQISHNSPKSKSKMADLDLVYSPTAIDVLCGTGQQERQHSGNIVFNRIVAQFSEAYNQATSKSEKMKISKKIVELLTQSGVRFLKKCPIYQNWYVGGPRVGRDKIGHFLRLHRCQQQTATS